MIKRPKLAADENGNGFKRLGARLAKTTRRSAFSIWLAQEDHYERLDETIKKHGVRWDEIAKWAMDERLTGDKPITGLAAKRAYERETVRRESAEKTQSVTSVKRAPSMQPDVRPSQSPNPVRMMPEPSRKPERKPAADDTSDTLDAGRGWLPKPRK